MFYMDAKNLVDFGTIKTAHGDVKAAFCVFFFQVLVPLYNKDFVQCIIIRKSFSGISTCCWANRVALFNTAQRFIFNRIKSLNQTVQNFPLIYLKKFYKIIVSIF